MNKVNGKIGICDKESEPVMAATDHAQAVKKDTKEFITTAMLQLLEKENLAMLTVSQVCSRAGVSRMAFYRNFDGLEQILYEFYQPKMASVFEMLRQNPEESVKFETQLSFFNSFGDFILLSDKRGFESVIRQIFTEETEKFYAAEGDKYWTAFMSAGVYAVWRKWLLEGQKRPLEEIMGLLRKFDAARNR